MSEQSSRALTYFFVIVFSAVVVALGAKDLQHRFTQRGPRTDADVKRLVRELQADPDDLRAGLARKAAAAKTDTTEESTGDGNKEEIKQIIEKIAP